ncbi:MAG: hypothetical protein U1F52_00350 [Burkholderiales bacterium]
MLLALQRGGHPPLAGKARDLIRACLAGAALAMAVAGCTTAPHRVPPFSTWTKDPDKNVADCATLFAAFDEAARRAAILDGGPPRVAGYPFLRADRTIAGLAASPRQDTDSLLREMRRLDVVGRLGEAANLPAAPRAALTARLGSEPLDAALIRCGDVLATRADVAALGAIDLPDDYSVGRRLAGAYWLSRIPFSSGVRRYQRETERTFALPVDRLPVTGTLQRYGVSAGADDEPSPDVLRFGAVRDRAALVPWFRRFAPVLEIDTAGDVDRIGRPRRRSDGSLDVGHVPVMFVRLAHTKVKGELWPQLVYSVWFPARPRSGVLDLLGGALDGITWRVTLGPDGRPWLFDAMHTCGCYHQFFPTARLRLRASPGGLDEWAFVPQTLPTLSEGDRTVLRIASATHFLQRILVVRDPPLGTSLRFEDDESLRSLPDEAGARRSLFRADGIVAGTERAERWLFWPMGIAAPGAMRQWGRHATAFIGRRHFDDIDLVERYFDVAPAGTR